MKTVAHINASLINKPGIPFVDILKETGIYLSVNGHCNEAGRVIVMDDTTSGTKIAFYVCAGWFMRYIGSENTRFIKTNDTVTVTFR